ncbi:putative activator of 90 kDa heat shock protein ATPase -like 1-like [Scophthalmus maximus]|uniref:Putative activator of 90 kDa heat shock protein ATPase-like 1-like n=1 Tax=Scophthalmus maximus TaxID=52904 RepID=A0A2U9CV36_SCOMX|nr:putative activator of 90 kDa heat shock protein ATPase -like 1-like [Scophthalmus maximus]
MERDVSSWSLQRLRRLLLGVKVTGSEGVCQLTDVVKPQRETHLLLRVAAERQLAGSVCDIISTSSGGVKYRGTVEVNDLSDENDLDVGQ